MKKLTNSGSPNVKRSETMTFPKRIAGIIALATFFAAFQSGFASGHKFIDLFNGKDLTGWRYSGPKGKSTAGLTQSPDGRDQGKDRVLVLKDKRAKGQRG